VVEGVAITFEPTEEFKEDEGLHENELAPIAVNKVDCPLHMVSSGETVIAGYGLTVMVTWVDAVHPDKFPTTVYVVLEGGLAVTFEPVDELREEAGVQK
jgi:hypothetical protein